MATMKQLVVYMRTSHLNRLITVLLFWNIFFIHDLFALDLPNGNLTNSRCLFRFCFNICVRAICNRKNRL